MNYRELHLYKKIKSNKFIYFFFYKVTNRDYKQKKILMKNSLKSVTEIKKEMKLIEDYWKCPAVHYIRYGLFNKDLSENLLLDYIPPYFFYNKYLPNVYKKMDILSYNNKMQQYNLLKKYNISTPEILGIVKKNVLRSCLGEIIDINNLIISYLIDDQFKLFFKPIDGEGGNGILVLKKYCNELLLNNKKIDKKDILNFLDPNKIYILQKGIIQRSDFRKINSSCVNTLRIITQVKDNRPEICICVMRIGQSNKEVDNSNQGGLSVNINIQNGALTSTATAEHGGGLFYSHPDTNFIFEGKFIQDWDIIKEKVLEYANKLSFLNELAWDVAITDNDEVEIIEFNFNYGIDHLQCTCGGVRKILNVYPL